MTLFSSSAAIIGGKVLSVGCIGLFAGQALSYNAILLPSLRRVPPESALPVWASTYHIGKNIQVGLVVTSVLAGLGLFYKTENVQYLVPPLINAVVVPYTLAFIMPVNKELLGLLDGKRKSNRSIEQLLDKWDLLHFGRTLLSSIAFVLALYQGNSNLSVVRL